MRRWIYTLVALTMVAGLVVAPALAQFGGGGFRGPGATLRGPTSSTDNAIVRFDGTTGKRVQNTSGVTIDDNDALFIETLNTPMVQTRHSETAGSGSGIAIRRSRGTTIGGNTIVQDNDVLGNLNFMGADGTDFEAAGIIRGEVDGAPSDGTDMPGALVFLTTPDASATPTERMRISSAGLITFAAGSRIVMDLTTADQGFIDFNATADADAVSAISTFNTSGATTDHIQILLNGAKAWIAISTNNPS